MAAPKIWLGRVGGRRDQSINQTCNLKTKNINNKIIKGKCGTAEPPSAISSQQQAASSKASVLSTNQYVGT